MGTLIPRYVAESRLSWEPPLFVVIDGDTGAVLSKHAIEDIAKATAEAMNHAADRGSLIG